MPLPPVFLPICQLLNNSAASDSIVWVRGKAGRVTITASKELEYNSLIFLSFKYG
jgi:hypothetical protein